MAGRVQDGFSDNTFVESRDIEDKETFLIMLNVIAQIYQFPQAIEAGEETDPELFPLVGWSGNVGRTILKNDLRLWQ